MFYPLILSKSYVPFQWRQDFDNMKEMRELETTSDGLDKSVVTTQKECCDSLHLDLKALLLYL